MPITPRQLDVLDFIVQFIRENRYAPTLQEMADQFDLSRVTVLQHLEALEEKGYLERQPNQARGITVKKKVETPSSKSGQSSGHIRDRHSGQAYNVEEEQEPEREAVQYALPMSGYLSDEQTVEQLDQPRFIPVDELLFRGQNCYLLEVRCDLLHGDHILEGDYLIVDEKKSGEPGDLVVVQGGSNETYIGRMGTEDSPERVTSVAEDQHVETRHPQENQVAGIVSGIVRMFD